MLRRQFVLSSDWIEGRSTFNGRGAVVVTASTLATDKPTPHRGTLNYTRYGKDDAILMFSPHDVHLAVILGRIFPATDRRGLFGRITLVSGTSNVPPDLFVFGSPG